MKSWLILSFLAVVMAFSSSCKKKTVTYTLQGKVTDLSFNNGLSGATVTLQLTSTTNNSLNKSLTTATKSDGTYEFSFDRDKYSEIKLTVSKNNYFGTSNTMNLEDLKVDGPTIKNFEVYAQSWVRIHATGNGTKTIRYFQQEGLMNCDECCPTGDQFLYNVIDDNVYCINNGNSTYGLYYFVLDSTINGPASIVTTPFDTVTISIGF